MLLEQAGLLQNNDKVSFQRYKIAKEEIKKPVRDTRTKLYTFKLYEEVYMKLDNKEIEMIWYKIVQI